ncbi:hypothetical protein [Longimicrobium terrae]|uniref:Uncharacterized protein n=1 Tax=Longimicrobium terrae TaxID=1639882 RepID=A0A841GYT9_9BACT|nr:hypothetical protein [Longimicrobium terrae]MBB4636525.1 hypothetical protein [Longimicrobium terrae]MBB6070951.1 hypothetical protein [Longimicrobium terrae]NNC28973.1 hypothetical protein [Longimicrobium terrae]
MMELTRRRLVSIRRFVPIDRIREYAELWIALHRAATAKGAHAWHFASADQQNVYMEFLEFGGDADVRGDPDTVAAIKALHEAFGDPYPTPMTLEEWVELPAPPPDLLQ